MSLSSKKVSPMTGVKVWKNPKNKFMVVEIHYTADPRKRSKEFKDWARSSLPYRDYMMEYELSWESWAGLPVFPDWIQERHALTKPAEPEPGLPLLRGWDFGLTPAAIICQLQGERLVVLKEFTAVNMGLKRFSKIVLDTCAIEFPRWMDKKKDWRDFIDPSGLYRKDTDEGTCATILDGHGLRIIPGVESFEHRRMSVEYFLTTFTKDGPCLTLNLDECPKLAAGFLGGYQYDDKDVEIEPKKIRPIKNEYSHPHDGFQMITCRLTTMKMVGGRPIPVPNYSALHHR